MPRRPTSAITGVIGRTTVDVTTLKTSATSECRLGERRTASPRKRPLASAGRPIAATLLITTRREEVVGAWKEARPAYATARARIAVLAAVRGARTAEKWR